MSHSDSVKRADGAHVYESMSISNCPPRLRLALQKDPSRAAGSFSSDHDNISNILPAACVMGSHARDSRDLRVG